MYTCCASRRGGAFVRLGLTMLLSLAALQYSEATGATALPLLMRARILVRRMQFDLSMLQYLAPGICLALLVFCLRVSDHVHMFDLRRPISEVLWRHSAGRRGGAFVPLGLTMLLPLTALQYCIAFAYACQDMYVCLDFDYP